MAPAKKSLFDTLIDLNDKFHEYAADLITTAKIQEDVAEISTETLKNIHNAALEAKVALSSEPKLKNYETQFNLWSQAPYNILDFYKPGIEKTFTIPEDVLKDLLDPVLNQMANLVHNAAIDSIGPTKQLKNCKIANLQPDNAIPVGKYCSGAKNSVQVTVAPESKFKVGNKTFIQNYPQLMIQPLGVHKVMPSVYKAGDEIKMAVEYHDSYLNHTGSANRLRGTRERLEMLGFDCNLGKTANGKYKQVKDIYCNIDDIAPNTIRELATFFSLLLNGDIAHSIQQNDEMYPVVRDKAWEKAVEYNAKYGDNTWESPVPHQLDWDEIANEWKQEQQFTKNPLYNDLRQLLYLRDIHHMIEEKYNIDGGAANFDAMKQILANGKKAQAILQKNHWGNIAGNLSMLQNLVDKGKAQGISGISDGIGHDIHSIVYHHLTHAGNYAQCVMDGSVGNISAGNLAYCEGILQGNKGTPIGNTGGNGWIHNSNPNKFTVMVGEDHYPDFEYALKINTKDLSPFWAKEIQKALGQKFHFSCAGQMCILPTESHDTIRQVAAFLSNLRGADEKVGEECAKKAIGDAYEASQNLKQKGVFTFAQEPIFNSPKGWIDKCFKQYGITPVGMSKEEEAVLKLIGPNKLYGGCSFENSDLLPDLGFIKYCSGVRQNPQGNTNAFINPQGTMLEQYFHGSTDKIANIMVETSSPGKYEVTISNLLMHDKKAGKPLQNAVVNRLKKIGLSCPTLETCTTNEPISEQTLRLIATYLSSFHQAYNLEPNCIPKVEQFVFDVAQKLSTNPEAFKVKAHPHYQKDWEEEVCAKPGGNWQLPQEEPEWLKEPWAIENKDINWITKTVHNNPMAIKIAQCMAKELQANPGNKKEASDKFFLIGMTFAKESTGLSEETLKGTWNLCYEKVTGKKGFDTTEAIKDKKPLNQFSGPDLEAMVKTICNGKKNGASIEETIKYFFEIYIVFHDQDAEAWVKHQYNTCDEEVVPENILSLIQVKETILNFLFQHHEIPYTEQALQKLAPPGFPLSSPPMTHQALEELVEEKKIVAGAENSYKWVPLETKEEQALDAKISAAIQEHLVENSKLNQEWDSKGQLWQNAAQEKDAYKKLPKLSQDIIHNIMDLSLLTGYKEKKSYEQILKELQGDILKLYPKLTPLMVKLQLDLEKKVKINKGLLPECDEQKCELPVKKYEDWGPEDQKAIHDYAMESWEQGNMVYSAVLENVMDKYGLENTKDLQTMIAALPIELSAQIEKKPGFVDINDLPATKRGEACADIYTWYKEAQDAGLPLLSIYDKMHSKYGVLVEYKLEKWVNERIKNLVTPTVGDINTLPAAKISEIIKTTKQLVAENPNLKLNNIKHLRCLYNLSIHDAKNLIEKAESEAKPKMKHIGELTAAELDSAEEYIKHGMNEGLSTGVIEAQLADEWPGGLIKDNDYVTWVSNTVKKINEEYPGLIETESKKPVATLVDLMFNAQTVLKNSKNNKATYKTIFNALSEVLSFKETDLSAAMNELVEQGLVKDVGKTSYQLISVIKKPKKGKVAPELKETILKYLAGYPGQMKSLDDIADSAPYSKVGEVILPTTEHVQQAIDELVQEGKLLWSIVDNKYQYNVEAKPPSPLYITDLPDVVVNNLQDMISDAFAHGVSIEQVNDKAIKILPATIQKDDAFYAWIAEQYNSELEEAIPTLSFEEKKAVILAIINSAPYDFDWTVEEIFEEYDDFTDAFKPTEEELETILNQLGEEDKITSPWPDVYHSKMTIKKVNGANKLVPMEEEPEPYPKTYDELSEKEKLLLGANVGEILKAEFEKGKHDFDEVWDKIVDELPIVKTKPGLKAASEKDWEQWLEATEAMEEKDEYGSLPNDTTDQIDDDIEKFIKAGNTDLTAINEFIAQKWGLKSDDPTLHNVIQAALDKAKGEIPEPEEKSTDEVYQEAMQAFYDMGMTASAVNKIFEGTIGNTKIKYIAKKLIEKGKGKPAPSPQKDFNELPAWVKKKIEFIAQQMLISGESKESAVNYISLNFNLTNPSVWTVVQGIRGGAVSQFEEAIKAFKYLGIGAELGGCLVENGGVGQLQAPTVAYCQGVAKPGTTQPGEAPTQAEIQINGTEVYHITHTQSMILQTPLKSDKTSLTYHTSLDNQDYKTRLDFVEKFLGEMKFNCEQPTIEGESAVMNCDYRLPQDGNLSINDQANIRKAALFLSSIDKIPQLSKKCIPVALEYAKNHAIAVSKVPKPWAVNVYPESVSDWASQVCSQVKK